MAPPAVDLPSKSQINKCGKYLTKLRHGGLPAGSVDPAQYDRATRTVSAYRGAHAYPLLKIRLGVQSMVLSSGASSVAVTQRLKRVPRIIRKLHRMPAMPLFSLEDIGGVRAVLANGPELEAARSRISKVWVDQIIRERDYIASPKPMGYRAVHLVVRRDDRAIEVQLRTKGQQQWADAVESADARLGFNLKDEEGPAEMIEYFAAAGEVIYRNEYGLAIPQVTQVRFDEARLAVVAAGYYRA